MSAKGKSPPGAAAIIGRARAALFGVAVGDALGATTEFMTPAQIRSRYGVLRDIVGGGWLNLPAYVQRNLVLRAGVQGNWRETGRDRQRTYFAGQLAYWF